MHIFFIQFEVIDIFLFTGPEKQKWRRPPSWIFRLREFDHSGVLIVWYLCSVPNLVQICALITERDTLTLQTFI